jgi:hypothetical protein
VVVGVAAIAKVHLGSGRILTAQACGRCSVGGTAGVLLAVVRHGRSCGVVLLVLWAQWCCGLDQVQVVPTSTPGFLLDVV